MVREASLAINRSRFGRDEVVQCCSQSGRPYNNHPLGGACTVAAAIICNGDDEARAKGVVAVGKVIHTAALNVLKGDEYSMWMLIMGSVTEPWSGEAGKRVRLAVSGALSCTYPDAVEVWNLSGLRFLEEFYTLQLPQGVTWNDAPHDTKQSILHNSQLQHWYFHQSPGSTWRKGSLRPKALRHASDDDLKHIATTGFAINSLPRSSFEQLLEFRARELLSVEEKEATRVERELHCRLWGMREFGKYYVRKHFKFTKKKALPSKVPNWDWSDDYDYP